MFYSHEVLTSRKYGFATVWLVATMGSGSKKVSRKAILDVDISKTCETIAAPAVPLALRLQSSLLYGVVKIYSQQCNYILSDAESIRNQLRQGSRLLQTNGLIAEGANKGRYERADNLVLGDDPAFLPELDLRMIDLDAPHHIEQFSNLALTNSLPVPTPRSASTSLSFGADLALGTPRRPGTIARLSDIINIAAAKRQTPHYEGLQDDLGIDFDFDGDARMQDTPTKPMTAPAVLPPDEPVYGDVMQLEDDYAVPGQHGFSSPLPSMVHNTENYHFGEARATSELVQVNLRQKRKRTVPLDASTEIRNHIIKSFQEEYVLNMEHDRRRKILATNQSISCDNALHWFLNTLQGEADSLDIFRGVNLISSITDIDLVTDRSTAVAHVSLERASLLPAPAADEDNGYVPDYNSVEIGREQPTPLDDNRQSTLLPWNFSSGLRRGGSQAAGSTAFDRLSRLPSLLPRSQLSLGVQSMYGDLPSMQDQDHHSPVEDAPTQLATESQWLRSALHDESMNFLTFVEDAVQQQGGKTASIDFSTLLPPLEHTTMTVAQAFLHILTLGTKNKLKAVQKVAFGDIMISLG